MIIQYLLLIAVYRLVGIYKKKPKILCLFCLYRLSEGKWREDELMVLSPCCSFLISLSADRQNAVCTDWMWHISLVIMQTNHFPTGKSKPCVGNLGTEQALEPRPRRVSQYRKKLACSAWWVVTLGNTAFQWPIAELQPYQPKMAVFKI